MGIYTCFNENNLWFRYTCTCMLLFRIYYVVVLELWTILTIMLESSPKLHFLTQANTLNVQSETYELSKVYCVLLTTLPSKLNIDPHSRIFDDNFMIWMYNESSIPVCQGMTCWQLPDVHSTLFAMEFIIKLL